MASMLMNRPTGCFARAPVRSRVAARRAVVVRAETAVKMNLCKPTEVKGLMNDRGYVFWDIRTPEEHAEGAKRWMKNVPFAFMTEKGPRANPKFFAEFQASFPNKMSRVIIGCDDGTDRSEMVYEKIAELGYTAVKVVDGGILALLEVDPIDKKDVKLQSWKAGPNAAN